MKYFTKLQLYTKAHYYELRRDKTLQYSSSNINIILAAARNINSINKGRAAGDWVYGNKAAARSFRENHQFSVIPTVARKKEETFGNIMQQLIQKKLKCETCSARKLRMHETYIQKLQLFLSLGNRCTAVHANLILIFLLFPDFAYYMVIHHTQHIITSGQMNPSALLLAAQLFYLAVYTCMINILSAEAASNLVTVGQTFLKIHGIARIYSSKL